MLVVHTSFCCCSYIFSLSIQHHYHQRDILRRFRDVSLHWRGTLCSNGNALKEFQILSRTRQVFLNSRTKLECMNNCITVNSIPWTIQGIWIGSVCGFFLVVCLIIIINWRLVSLTNHWPYTDGMLRRIGKQLATAGEFDLTGGEPEWEEKTSTLMDKLLGAAMMFQGFDLDFVRFFFC